MKLEWRSSAEVQAVDTWRFRSYRDYHDRKNDLHPRRLFFRQLEWSSLCTENLRVGHPSGRKAAFHGLDIVTRRRKKRCT